MQFAFFFTVAHYDWPPSFCQSWSASRSPEFEMPLHYHSLLVVVVVVMLVEMAAAAPLLTCLCWVRKVAQPPGFSYHIYICHFTGWFKTGLLQCTLCGASLDLEASGMRPCQHISHHDWGEPRAMWHQRKISTFSENFQSLLVGPVNLSSESNWWSNYPHLRRFGELHVAPCEVELPLASLELISSWDNAE